jgi:hypothetical protein
LAIQNPTCFIPQSADTTIVEIVIRYFQPRVQRLKVGIDTVVDVSRDGLSVHWDEKNTEDVVAYPHPPPLHKSLSLEGHLAGVRTRRGVLLEP